MLSAMAVFTSFVFSVTGAQAALSLSARHFLSNQASAPTQEVLLAFNSPAPSNASDPCRTGETAKQSKIGDHDSITVCTFGSGGIPLPTDASSDRLVWAITDIYGATSAAVSFDQAGPPPETTGAGATAQAAIDSVQVGEVLVTVFLVEGNGTLIDSSSLELQVEDCSEPAQMSEGGDVILPDDAVDVVGPVVVEEDLGRVTDLYPNVDTSTDAYYGGLLCDPSIDKGTLPSDAEEEPSPAEVEAQDYLEKFEDATVNDIVQDLERSPLKLPKLPLMRKSAPCFTTGPDRDGDGRPDRKRRPCDSPRFLQHDQPFEGKDIVYVHGLALGHMEEWIKGNVDAKRKWPGQPAEYLNPTGYFREYAEAYWVDHIREHLFDPGNKGNHNAGIDWSSGAPAYHRKSNRYLAVAWSSNQTLEYAQHAFLRQVQLAIQSNKNVVESPVYPSKFSRPFGSNGLIIISHSTGALIVSSALSRAAAGDFGPTGKAIAKYVQLHVSFAGAISGSALATVGMAIGMAVSQVPQILCDIADALKIPCGGNTSFVTSSIFRDLMPPVAQLVWGDEVNTSPVPTLTVAGGHPVGNYALGITKVLLPGLDDGVATMNSACGSPAHVHTGVLPPSGITVSTFVKAYDRGIPAARATKNFISHLDLQSPPVTRPSVRYLAGGCTPYLSPTGMLMPVTGTHAGTVWDTRNRYGNHFSFIQSSADHSYEGGSDPSNQWPSAKPGGASSVSIPRQYLPSSNFGPNCEEMSAVTDSGIYKKFADGTYLVQPSFQNEMHQVVRGLKFTFKLFKNSKKTYSRWIWKRNYFLLDGLGCERSSSHYVYQYVGRR